MVRPVQNSLRVLLVNLVSIQRTLLHTRKLSIQDNGRLDPGNATKPDGKLLQDGLPNPKNLSPERL